MSEVSQAAGLDLKPLFRLLLELGYSEDQARQRLEGAVERLDALDPWATSSSA